MQSGSGSSALNSLVSEKLFLRYLLSVLCGELGYLAEIKQKRWGEGIKTLQH